jgi:UDP:flavonoid glycosyltransferase YjiC (YdhE family)
MSDDTQQPTKQGKKMPNLFESLKRIFKAHQRRSKRKTVLFAPLDSLGHINSLISIANHLKNQNHRTVFLFFEPISNKLKEAGHEVYDCTTPDLVESVDSDAAQDKWNEVIIACREIWKSGDVGKNLTEEIKLGFGAMVEDIKKYNDNLEKKLELIKPDILVLDHYFGAPAFFKDPKRPWIRIFSASPLAIHSHPDLPAAWLGLPTKWDKNDPKQKELNDNAIKAKMELYESYNAYWKSFGYPDLPKEPISYIPVSPYLNIYMYPEELDYANEYPLKDWQRCDCMVRNFEATKFEMPEKIRDKPGKLIFLSLGSLASADVELMKRLTSMLADCPHRFIVCKGPLHDQYELPDNMWGDKFVPQLEVLSSIDLIITHGGNNTITESFYYGVPGFIVCPLFGDQFDNANRLQEKGLGTRLDPYNCSKEQLHEAIETMLNKTDVKERMMAISQRMRTPEARTKAVRLVSDMVAKH